MFKFNAKLLLTGSVFIGSSVFINANAIADTSITLDDIIVTENRHSQSVDDSLASVTVITRQDIEKSAAKDLPSLLNRSAGFDLKPSGPYGKVSSLFLRGTNSNHLLTLVDGVKLYSASSGGSAFQHIPLNQVERIEIVRGPRSSLYGSEAIGGVIQIFTRKGTQKTSASTNIGAGSNKSKEISASFSGGTEKANFSLSARHFKTDGIDAIFHTTANDDDGYENDSMSAQFGYQFNQEISFQSSFMNAQGNSRYDNCLNSSYTSSDNCDSDFVQQVFSSSLKFTPDSIWDGQLQLGRSRDLDDNFWESTQNYTFETEREEISFINSLQFTDQQLIILGVDHADDEVISTAFTAPSRDNTGVFLEWDSQFSALDINISARRDDNEQFNTHNTGSIAIGHPVTDNIRATYSHGTAFKAPTFNDLYFPFYGVDTLVPEESASSEIGLRGKYTAGFWSVNYYQTDIDNLIAFDTNTFLAGNINKAEIKGLEIISETTVDQWDINLTLSYTDPVNKSAANYGKQLVARAKQAMNLQLLRDFGKFSFGASLLAQSEHFTTADNSESVAGYGVLDSVVSYNFTQEMKLSANLTNILDKDYVINEGFGDTYNTLGRSLFINLSYNM